MRWREALCTEGSGQLRESHLLDVSSELKTLQTALWGQLLGTLNALPGPYGSL